MKNCLLLLAVVAMVAVVAPAYSQTLYLDTNGDGMNSLLEKSNGNNAAPDDVLGASTTAVDVYFDSNHNPDGSTVLCPQDPSQPYDMFSYEATVRASGSGTVTFNGWTDALGWSIGIITIGDHTFATAGSDAWFGRGTASSGAVMGRFKVGTLSVSVTGTPKLDFATSSTIDPSAQTAFGGHCYAPLFDNTNRLGEQYPTSNAFGTEAPVPVVPTTWGKIKNLYH
jgi:hypothetical protein